MMSSIASRDSADRLQTRLFRDSDVPGLLRLWESQSDWGALTAEVWNSWYRNTPFGDCIIVVTSDERDEIVGQLVFTPSRIRVAGTEVAALRMSSPIFARSQRRGALAHTSHPVAQMYATGVLEGISQGVGVVYAFPTRKWLPVWRRWRSAGVLMGRAFEADFRTLAVDLAGRSEKSGGGNGMLVSVVENLNEEHVSLWQRARMEMPVVCAVDRTAASLRFSGGEGFSLESRREDGTLNGYAMVRRDGLLADFFAATSSEIAPVLETMTQWLAEATARGSVDFNSLKIMETPPLALAAQSLGGVPLTFTFAFVCAIVAPDIPDIATDPGNWYLTPGP